MRAHTRIRTVDEEGIALTTTGDQPLDVWLTGRRIWTFWTIRDTARAGRLPGPRRRVAWPDPLRRYLDGRAEVEVRDPVTGAALFHRQTRFGGSERPVEIRNRRGIELSMDKSGRLVPTFEARSADDLAAVGASIRDVVEALQQAGLEPFLAYGTLLGAVREGRVLAHDSDVDLGYVSRHRNPFDVVRESFRVERRLRAEGWRTARYSGGSFKVLVPEGDVTRGIDVFGGFLDERRLYLMGEVAVPYRKKWLRPLGTTLLGSEPLPVPARPEKLLEAMYGAGWRVPDPAFRFTTPERAVRAFDDWFRGLQPGIRYWERQAALRASRPPKEPSALAKAAAKRAAELGADVLDVGAGRGGDALWLAGQGFAVTAYDFVPRAAGGAAQLAGETGHPFEVRSLNVADTRAVLAEGARLAHSPRPRVVLARHLLDATSVRGRDGFARLCSMALRSGGAVLAEFHAPPVLAVAEDESDRRPEWAIDVVDPEEVGTLLRRAGATEVRTRRPDRSRSVRMVGEWRREG